MIVLSPQFLPQSQIQTMNAAQQQFLLLPFLAHRLLIAAQNAKKVIAVQQRNLFIPDNLRLQN
jgi:hypothetical protein